MSNVGLYMMCGLPFAGKSTLARVVAAHLGAVHLETDAITTERGLGANGKAITMREWAATYREAYRRLEALLRDGHTIVYDAVNYRRVQRDQLRRIARRCDVTAQVVFVTTSAERARQRLECNRVQQTRFDVRDEDFAEVAGRFEPPTADEHVLHYDGDEPVEQWLARCFPLSVVRS
jgi:predicted kinase